MEIDRQQPHSLEIERAILSAVLRTGDIARVNDNRVDTDTFYSHVHREIFKAALNVKKNGSHVDLITVADRLNLDGKLEAIGGEVLLAEIYNTIATDANLDDWIKHHLEYYAKRLFIQQCSKVIAECFSGDKASREIYNNNREALGNIEAFSCGMTQKPTSEKLNTFAEYLQDLQTGAGGHVIPFGIPGLDDLMQLQLKQMFVLGGLSNTGKTRFIFCDAIGKAKKNIASAIFSFENPVNITFTGLVSIISGVSAEDINKKNGLTDVQTSKINKARQFLNNKSNLLYVFGKGEYNHSVAGISSEIKRIQDNTGGKLKIAYIDYLQNMKASKRLSRVEQIESCISGISDMAAEYNIATMVLTQLNRDKDRDKNKRRPILADMKGSGEIENAADYVVFLHRANKAPGAEVELDIYTEKVRGTNVFNEKLFFNTFTGKISGIMPRCGREYRSAQ